MRKFLGNRFRSESVQLKVIGTAYLIAVLFFVFGFINRELRAEQKRDPVRVAMQNITNNNPIRQQARTAIPEIVAEVNGEKITRDQLAQEVIRNHGQALLERMINRELILQECDRQKIYITKDDIDREIDSLAARFNIPREQYIDIVKKDHNMTSDQYASEVVWPMLALRALAVDQIQVTQEELDQMYQRKYGPSVQVLMIVAKTKEAADALQQKVAAAPDTFGEVAKNESIDAQTASMSGRVPAIFPYTMPDPQMEKMIFGLQEGEISAVYGPFPPTGPDQQYMIFKCEKKYPPAEISPEAKTAFENELRRRVSEEKLARVAESLFKALQSKAELVNVINNPQLRKNYPDVAAMINGKTVKMSTLVTQCFEQYGKSDLEMMIYLTLIRQECKKIGLTVSDGDIDTEIWIKAAKSTPPLKGGSPDIQTYLAGELAFHDLPEAAYRANIVWPSIALKKLVEGNVAVTPDDIQKSFEANYGQKVQCLGIVMNDERKVREVWQNARDLPKQENRDPAEVFGELAAQYSSDPNSKTMRGRIDPIIKNGGIPALEEVAFKMKPGELSEIIQVEGQYIILYCLELIPPVDVTLDDAKPILERDIKEKKTLIEIGKFLDGVQERSLIVNSLDGKTSTPKTKTVPQNAPVLSNDSVETVPTPNPQK